MNSFRWAIFWGSVIAKLGLTYCNFQTVDSKISYTTDVWTAANYLAFMGVTAHWITPNMEQKFVTLDFIPLEGRHTGQNLGDQLVESIQAMGTLEKVCFPLIPSEL